jgi:hypothetical protein
MKSKKNTIRLTESELKKVISESVKKVLKEYDETNSYDEVDDDDYIYGENSDANLDENEKKLVPKVEEAIERINYVLHYLNMGDEYIMGASELCPLVKDAWVLMTCAKYGLKVGKVPSDWLYHAFGEAAKKYIP